MSAQCQCQQCGTKCLVIPARSESFRFCSYECRGKWRSIHWTGPNNPRWLGGEREKICGQCGLVFSIRRNQPITQFKTQKFCSKKCADEGGLRYEGEQHPNFKPSSRRNDRRGKHGAWARSVISRDAATCQKCGLGKVEMHAHHIKSFAGFPELRWDLANGITLCYQCHWAVHAALNENPVNSVNTLTDNAEGNTEPSFGRKPLEGVTTRGRAYRRWDGKCKWCEKHLSKRWSDVKGSKNVFCSLSCSAKHTRSLCGNIRLPMAVISSTSAGAERQDIV